MSKKYIEVTADTNDGDYVTKRTLISDEKLKEIRPVIKAIKAYDDDKSIKYQKWNWWGIYEDDRHPSPTKLYVDTGKCTEKQLNLFDEEYVPTFEHGVHTIESVIILHVLKEEKLV